MEQNFAVSFSVRGLEKQFHFDKTDNPALFQVSVVNDLSVPVFYMTMDGEGIWIFHDHSLPEWIKDLEMELGDAIEEHVV
jgi:hypothetical protein